jgi:hypothetical protein
MAPHIKVVLPLPNIRLRGQECHLHSMEEILQMGYPWVLKELQVILVNKLHKIFSGYDYAIFLF